MRGHYASDFSSSGLFKSWYGDGEVVSLVPLGLPRTIRGNR